MAIDKSRTSPMMKTTIVFLAVVLAIGIIGLPVVGALSECSSNTPNANSQSSLTTTQTVDAIAAQHTPVVQATEASLTVSPKDYALLVKQGNNYFEWALAVREALKGAATDDVPIWQQASGYYLRALKVKPGDSNVITDYSVTLYYSNQVAQAISTAEQVVAKDPKFAPVRFNLGLYYETAGDKAKAEASFEEYLKLDPTGTNADTAKTHVAQLSKS